MRQLVSRPPIMVLSILLLALLIRLAGLTARPIWYDEAFSILFAEKGPEAMVFGTLAPEGAGSADIHPLEYYTMLWMWMRAFGQSLAAVRSLSILAGLGAVTVLYLIGRELLGSRIAKIGALLCAVAPFQVHFSQEIRMYALMTLWLLACTYSYVRGRASGQRGWWILFAIFAAAAQYTHNLAALYLLPLALTPVFQRHWRSLRAVFWSGLLAIALYLPWLIHLPAQIAKVQQAYWTLTPGLEKIFTLLLVYTTNLPLPATWLLPALFIALTVLMISLWQTVKAARKARAFAAPGLWLFYLAFAPPVLALIISQWQPIYVERSFLPSAAIFCLWVAWAAYGTSAPRAVSILMTVLLAVGAAAGIWQHVTYAGFPYAPFAQMEEKIEGEMQPGDAILHSSKLSLLPSIYYNREWAQGYIADPPGSSVDTLAPATRQVLGLESFPNLAAATQGRDRLWFIIFQQSVDEFVAAGEATHPHLAWLDEHYRLEGTEDWGDLRVFQYTRLP